MKNYLPLIIHLVILSCIIFFMIEDMDKSKTNFQNRIDALEFQIQAQRAYEGELARRMNILYEETGCVSKLENTCNE